MVAVHDQPMFVPKWSFDHDGTVVPFWSAKDVVFGL